MLWNQFWIVYSTKSCWIPKTAISSIQRVWKELTVLVPSSTLSLSFHSDDIKSGRNMLKTGIKTRAMVKNLLKVSKRQHFSWICWLWTHFMPLIFFHTLENIRRSFTKCSNILKEFLGYRWWIVWVYLAILWKSLWYFRRKERDQWHEMGQTGNHVDFRNIRTTIGLSLKGFRYLKFTYRCIYCETSDKSR